MCVNHITVKHNYDQIQIETLKKFCIGDNFCNLLLVQCKFVWQRLFYAFNILCSEII